MTFRTILGNEHIRSKYGNFGNLYFSWPKLFNTFSHILTSFFVQKCIHSIIIHQYMSKLCILMQNLNF